MKLLQYFVALIVTSVACLGSPVVVKGAHGGVNADGCRPSRLPFDDFALSGPAFDLYILSLQQIQKQNQSEQLSYYQIAGIHGRPFIQWGGVIGNYEAGYCAHGSILFPMWHRPYLALFEQILWKHAQSISKLFPFTERKQYQAAALTLRIPYWDWAFNATMPDLVNQQYISINTPQGRMSVANPLYSYTFHPHPSTSDFPPSDPVSVYPVTVRYPDANGNSQPWKSNAQLQANAAALKDLTYQLLSDQTDYAPFSNIAYSIGRNGRYNSIENMHDAIHSLVGQTGHMGIIPYSSFDPIFWLHHANVDRLVAMWQAIHPDSFTTPQIDYNGTYTERPGTVETINNPLTPFYSDNDGTFFTSATARYTRRFGYTYPELIDWNVNATQLSLNARSILNTLYNPTSSISKRSLPKRINDKQVNTTPFQNPTSANHQYYINVRVDKAALNQSFFIHFFLGPIPKNHSIWSTAPTLIATQPILFTPLLPLNPNISSTTSYGQISLAHVLNPPSLTSHNLYLHSLAPAHVIPLLTQHLSWKLQTYNPSTQQQEPVDILSHPQLRDTLKIFVVGREVLREGMGVQLPVHGSMAIWKDATRGKVGELGEGEGW